MPNVVIKEIEITCPVDHKPILHHAIGTIEAIDWLRDKFLALELTGAAPLHAISVVGTRTPHFRSVEICQSIVGSLGNTELTIVSGFAQGIDQVAHRSAIEAGLRTIAILGSGYDFDYPAGAKQLREMILDSNSILLTEFGKDGRPYPSHFPKRNRMIAHFSSATAVIEGGLPSGALGTAFLAVDFHRDAYAVPTFPGTDRFAGNQRLLEKHYAAPLWSAEDFGGTFPRLWPKKRPVWSSVKIPSHLSP